MAAYNAEKYVGEAIASILNQSFTDFELIIADDGSSDATRAVIDSFDDSRIILSHNEENNGKADTVNRLFSLCNGEFITIHDADDISLNERFTKQINYLRKNKDVGICGTAFITIEEDGKIFSKNILPSSHDEIMETLADSSNIHGPTALFRKSIVDKLGIIYRPYFQNHHDDSDLFNRILCLSKGHNLVEPYYLYRILENSICRKDVSIISLNMYKVVYHLTKQRFNKGYDDLMMGDIEKVDKFFKEHTRVYHLDASLIHREAAAYLLYYKLNRKAIIESLKGMLKAPNIINLRTIVYCIRKSFI